MSDLHDIDYKKIVQLVDKVEKLTKDSHQKLAKPMLESIPEMFLSADKVVSDVGSQITSVQSSALDAFNSVFKSILDHEKAVQKKQKSEKPIDFKPDPIPDLREKISLGFPREDPLFFEEIIPKIKLK